MNNGLLSLRFSLDRHGRTRMVERKQRYPLTTTAVLPMESELGALVYTHNAAGSVFGGDRLHTNLHLGNDAAMCLSTPSATRLQGEGLSVQTTNIELSSGAYFESIPDMLIPHPKAEYRQQTSINLSDGAEAILAESLAPGRVARGEKNIYNTVSTRLEASFRGQTILVDASTFRPQEASPTLEGALASGGYVGTLIILTQNGDQEKLAAEVSARLEKLPGVYGGAAVLASGYGAISRFLAENAPALRIATQVAWNAARYHIRGRPAPQLRK
ncbi:urease accessory protein UreD [Salinicola peritrichatus]|uniref:urease accessory protein UreD n=1 Tax=Salinicola peritrichatus TaxID=1267424 RepID=UPI000DA1733E|nr:urease accessory protein UreD [Salinicola peritrichatus]